MAENRAGRLPSTTRGELSCIALKLALKLFPEKGFEVTTVDDRGVNFTLLFSGAGCHNR